MSPSPRNPCHDPRWTTSSRSASLATIVLNAGLVLGLVLIQTAPAPPVPPRPLSLVFLVPVRPEPPAPASVDMVAVEQPPAQIAPSPPPPPAEMPARPPKTQPPKPRTKPVPPLPPVPSPPTPDTAQVEVVARPPVAAPAPGAAHAASAAPQAVPSSKPSELTHILAALTQLIERHKDYPKAARRAGYEGVVVMRVSMDKNGVITGWSLDQTSAHPVLDKAAEKTFGRLLGQKIEGATLDGELRVLVPVKYELRGQG